ncbi:hypothetical protein OG478_00490 [Streptomyces phaeochromogenes]|nr:hypothetical protein OG478_00490 [Streptomyces phaeochromogenes]
MGRPARPPPHSAQPARPGRFILTALAVLGGDTLTDFALALLIGLAVGTYSSMFTATPLAIELHQHGGTGRIPAVRDSVRH